MAIIKGSHNGKDFTAGMVLKPTQTTGVYRIIRIAPFLRQWFYINSPLRMHTLEARCKGNGWELEVLFDDVEKEKKMMDDPAMRFKFSDLEGEG